MKKPRIPVQQRAIDKKQRIIDAAFKLFNCKGLYNCTIKDITYDADVSIGTFYAYFEDKEDVLMEIVKQHKMQQVENPIIAMTNKMHDKLDFKTVFQIINNIFGFKNLPENLQRLVSGLRYTHPKFIRFHQKEEEITVTILKKLLNSFKDLRKKTDIETTSKMLLLILKESLRAYSVYKGDLKHDIFIYELTVIVYNYLFYPHPA